MGAVSDVTETLSFDMDVNEWYQKVFLADSLIYNFKVYKVNLLLTL